MTGARARAAAVALAALALASCNDPASSNGEGSGRPAASSPPVAASASSAEPAALVRRKTPVERRKVDEDVCAGGRADACRSMADRYRGYGAAAGCGVERDRPAPRLKRMPDDTEDDAKAYLRFIRRACDLGDGEACSLERLAPIVARLSTAFAEDGRAKSSVDGSALWRWQRETRPELSALLDQSRKECLAANQFWSCSGSQTLLYRRDGKPKTELAEPVRARAESICATTLECTDVLMMLDKEGYSVEAVEPVRRRMAATLVDACLAGSCVCGEAARHLPPDDARRVALARAGCDDGEAEGCFELGLLYDEGRGVARDEARAVALYELACPAMRPLESKAGPRQGEYSPRACDRLAARHEAGAVPPKEPGHAWYYALAACQRPGFERDHAPCLRLSRLHLQGPNTGRNLEDAHIASLGPQMDPVNRKECNRATVAAACKDLEQLEQKSGR